MLKQLFTYLFLLLVFCGCNNNRKGTSSTQNTSSAVTFKYAKNISVEQQADYIKVSLADPWKAGHVLHTYYLVQKGSDAKVPDDGTMIQIPMERGVFLVRHMPI